ncbi:interferon phi 1 isoform X3 [Denticeps clupeoides]|uniref:interferon phi 1 isoform X3 n=1 Tax=Denticeps clupeoides TaxID=299321 RepID=UPI0010A528C5|nr:uncharacterized protein LOC114794712 isoform X3 [Denticeps clupeoides]
MDARATRTLLLVLLAVLGGPHGACAACRWLQRYHVLSAACVRSLGDMGGQFSTESLLIHTNLYMAAHNATYEEKVEFLYESSCQILHLFRTNQKAASGMWNNTELNNFLEVLYRQSSSLKECVYLSKKTSPMRKKVKRYFKKLMAHIQSKNAWELMRKVVKDHLLTLDLLVKLMLNGN